MPRSLLAFTLVFATAPLFAADPPPPLVEKFLHDGKFADGETACLLAVEANPKDDEARFGLGVIQFLRAVENLGRALHEYGAEADKTTLPFLRLPVPKNPSPSALSYKSFGRVLDAFAADLTRAEATLAAVKDDKVKLRLRLAAVKFDFGGGEKERITLAEVLNTVNGGRFDFLKKNPDFRIHFDRGDVAWLRGYCHLLSAFVEAYRSVDEEVGFADRMKGIFPKVEEGKKADADWTSGLKVVDAPRLRRFRLHLVAVCELNRETWKHIRAETDDDHEWLPHPKQTDLLGLPLTNERIDAWLGMTEQLEGLLKGEQLLSGAFVRLLVPEHPAGQGLNVKKVLDDPPADLFNVERFRKGIAAKYLEAEEGKKAVDVNALFAGLQLFLDPFGFAYAARLN
jgi:hypothetical protein